MEAVVDDETRSSPVVEDEKEENEKSSSESTGDVYRLDTDEDEDNDNDNDKNDHDLSSARYEEVRDEEQLQMCFDQVAITNDEDEDGDSLEDSEEDDSNSDDDYDYENEEIELEMDRAWLADPFDYNNLQVSFEDVGERLKQKLREGVERLRDRINLISKAQPNESNEHSDEVRNFSAYANLEFWQHLVKFLNKNRNDKVEAVDGFTICSFVKSLLWCAYYQKSPGHMMKNKTLFPGFTTELKAIGGKDRFQEIIALFKSPKQKLTTSWDAYFSLIPDIRKVVRIVSENCANVAYSGTPNDITIDDDKWRFRSSNWSELGYSRRKGLKSFGCVLNMACDCPTGLFVSGAITSFAETATNSTKVILQRALHVETTEEVLMSGAMIHGDRGYNDDAFLQFCNAIKASVFFTVKRGPTLPYSFGSTHYKCNRDQQVIPENGCQTVYCASRIIDGKKLYFSGYRNGTGRVVFFASSSLSYAGTKWSIILKKQCDRRRYLSSEEFDPTEEVTSTTSTAYDRDWKRIFCTEGNLEELTESQRTPEWFLLRKFCITSTVAKIALDGDPDKYNDEEKNWLRVKLGKQFTDPIESIGHVDYSLMPFDELFSKGKKELIDICKSYGHSSSGNKTDIVNRILLGINVNTRRQNTDLERLAKAWFMKPIVNRTALKLGSVNESFVLHAIKNLNQFDPHVKVIEGPYEFGLVRRGDKPWLATSVDGMMELSIYNADPITCAVEIKTMTSANTLMEARNIASQMFQVTYCSFGDDKFKKGVKSEYRTQCIHHACVMRVNVVLLVVASDVDIIYMMMIDFTREELAQYEKLLDQVSTTLDWVYGDEPFPSASFGEEGVTQNGYHVDIHSIRMQLSLWKSTHNFIKNHGNKPLPPCRYIVPSGIAYWNKTKGFVDVMSRLLSHIKIPFKRGGPVLQLIVRFLGIMIVNGHLTTSLLKLTEHDILEEDSYNDIRQKMSNESTLTDYVRILASEFELPGCMFAENNQEKVNVDCSLEPEFAKLPHNRCLHSSEIAKFKTIISHKRKLCLIFNKGLPKKIRLDTSYRHVMIDAEKQGRCVLCLAQKRDSWPKYKCKTCGVYLCRTPRDNARLSCVEKWHSNIDLSK